MKLSGGEVVGGHEDGRKREGAGADKCHLGGRWRMGRVGSQNGEFKLSKFEVVGVVRKNREMVKWVLVGG